MSRAATRSGLWMTSATNPAGACEDGRDQEPQPHARDVHQREAHRREQRRGTEVRLHEPRVPTATLSRPRPWAPQSRGRTGRAAVSPSPASAPARRPAPAWRAPTVETAWGQDRSQRRAPPTFSPMCGNQNASASMIAGDDRAWPCTRRAVSGRENWQPSRIRRLRRASTPVAASADSADRRSGPWRTGRSC
jgi:hypothetical protein